MSWHMLHGLLHALIYVFGAMALVFYLLCLKPSRKAFALLAIACVPLLGMAWLAADLISEHQSPLVTYTGPVISRTHHLGKNSNWYTLQLAVHGQPTEDLQYLPEAHVPARGDVVAMTVQEFNHGETQSIHVLSGKQAGYTFEAANMTLFDSIGIAVLALVFALVFRWWRKELRLERADGARPATAAA